MAATQRLLLVGSSHFTRLQDYLQQNPEAAAGTNFHFVARKGLRAAEGLKFVKRHHQEIANFKPTHVIIHLGGNDVLPRNQKLPLGDLATAISHLKLLGKWLASQYNAQVFYSEFLPHARYPCPPRTSVPGWHLQEEPTLADLQQDNCKCQEQSLQWHWRHHIPSPVMGWSKKGQERVLWNWTLQDMVGPASESRRT